MDHKLDVCVEDPILQILSHIKNNHICQSSPSNFPQDDGEKEILLTWPLYLYRWLLWRKPT